MSIDIIIKLAYDNIGEGNLEKSLAEFAARRRRKEWNFLCNSVARFPRGLAAAAYAKNMPQAYFLHAAAYRAACVAAANGRKARSGVQLKKVLALF